MNELAFGPSGLFRHAALFLGHTVAVFLVVSLCGDAFDTLRSYLLRRRQGPREDPAYTLGLTPSMPDEPGEMVPRSKRRPPLGRRLRQRPFQMVTAGRRTWKEYRPNNPPARGRFC